MPRKIALVHGAGLETLKLKADWIPGQEKQEVHYGPGIDIRDSGKNGGKTVMARGSGQVDILYIQISWMTR